MNSSIVVSWARAFASACALAGVALVSACGGGDGSSAPAPNPLDVGNSTEFATVLAAVPAASSPGGGGGATSLTIHYRRLDGNTAGWQVHSWGAGKDPGWNVGWNPSGSDAFGAIYEVPLQAATGEVGYLFHNGDTKDHGGADQRHVLVAGRNEIWRIEGDATTYLTNPISAGAPDIRAVRVHYKRYDAAYANWGVHIWDGSGIDVAGLKAGVTIGVWNAPVAFTDFNNPSTGAGEVVFEIPVLNPKDDPANRKALEFIIHGMAPNENDKDGRDDNIKVDYAALSAVAGQVGDVWLVQGDATVYTSAPDTRAVSTTDAKAYWLDKRLIKWPRVDGSGVFKLYHSARGQIAAAKDAAVSGADGSVTLDVFSGSVPGAAAERFRYVEAGVVLTVKDADVAQLGSLHKSQLLLVQEDAAGKVRNATTAQVAGALDDLYAAATAVNDLGVSIAGGSTRFKLWAPTAQKVTVYTYDSGTGPAVTYDEMAFDAATGVWSAARSGDLSGKYYRFAVEVFVRGVGLVRNFVTDPYSVSLTTDSRRSFIADLSAANLKPAGWDNTPVPATVASQVDMTIYELHVRDFSINDASVPAAHRGKYLAFTEGSSNGMKHLKALAQSGLTDVHLLPVFDIATVPESGCVTPSVTGGPADETQQAAIGAVRDADCFNWGYDPYHYTAPEGSYATDAADGAKRIVEFRQMVMALHAAGLRVGMDVVYNHTSASGQTEKSVLDRIVPGYYHRLNAMGAVEKSTCCDNTATENAMMGKLMIDSALTWATQYKVDSFRFDLMAHQPRAVMEDMKAKLTAAAGREVQLIGEGWNFGEVADGARFVQASQLSLNGSGIGTFSDRARDHIRGGGPFDGGTSLVSNQGFINGLFYDDNGSGANRSRTDLMWAADMVKVGLAGSIRDYPLVTHWDATRQLQQLDYGGQPAGYVTQPGEVVNYVENHDNQTLFDINVYKLPMTTSTADRARVQMLGAALNVFSQGVSYFHAGIDTLRSKSLDRNSYNSGDWFNRIDWTYGDNYFGTGAPPAGDNGDNYPVIKPLLANGGIKPAAADIALARDMFRDLLKIRSSTTLLRLRTADDIKARLRFHNTGSTQNPVVIVGHLDGNGYAGAGFKELMYFVNVDKTAQQVTIDAEKGKAYVLHPVQDSASAADTRVKTSAAYEPATGRFTLPARSAVVYVVN
ncbi:alpha-1,6-glucosidase domain-containing protein [Methylibium rhizosphaerae]|uniref:alpha-1,6-glucosidase domain-containing protein n=1 Tax=Methylibium rhizosphaerae TaxID=2570323 RepID=UPI001FE2F58C|nr:alpha-1,6-glucosidase domain-containing protein [Methylibium rhizosphaerae]